MVGAVVRQARRDGRRHRAVVDSDPGHRCDEAAVRHQPVELPEQVGQDLPGRPPLRTALRWPGDDRDDLDDQRRDRRSALHPVQHQEAPGDAGRAQRRRQGASDPEHDRPAPVSAVLQLARHREVGARQRRQTGQGRDGRTHRLRRRHGTARCARRRSDSRRKEGADHRFDDYPRPRRRSQRPPRPLQSRLGQVRALRQQRQRPPRALDLLSRQDPRAGDRAPPRQPGVERPERLGQLRDPGRLPLPLRQRHHDHHGFTVAAREHQQLSPRGHVPARRYRRVRHGGDLAGALRRALAAAPPRGHRDRVDLGLRRRRLHRHPAHPGHHRRTPGHVGRRHRLRDPDARPRRGGGRHQRGGTSDPGDRPQSVSGPVGGHLRRGVRLRGPALRKGADDP